MKANFDKKNSCWNFQAIGLLPYRFKKLFENSIFRREQKREPNKKIKKFQVKVKFLTSYKIYILRNKICKLYNFHIW